MSRTPRRRGAGSDAGAVRARAVRYSADKGIRMHLLPNPLIIPVGIIIGILVAAPVGPVNVLCIQRAIERGFWGGIAAGLGAMLGDGLIALCAALGVGAITGAVQYHRMTIQILGGLVLIAFAWKLYFAAPRFTPVVPGEKHKETLRDFVWDIPQTFALTITNPGAVLGLFAIFGAVSTFVEVEGYVDALTIVAAVMGGSLAWWVGLSHLISRFRHRVTETQLRRINQIAGLLLLGFGVLLVGEVALKWTGAVY
jgi:threonine/homoserine/homoserine lactone efflux protein